jgi:hypothetical protein
MNRRRAMWLRPVGLVVMACGENVPPPCEDLSTSEAACLLRDDCQPSYGYGLCDDCPAIFGGCSESAECFGTQTWICGQPKPAQCAAEQCVPAANDACAAMSPPNCGSCELVAYEVCQRDPEDAETCLLTFEIHECKNPDAQSDCKDLADSECALRPDCVHRTLCVGPTDCIQECWTTCAINDDCDAYESCQDTFEGSNICLPEQERCDGDPPEEAASCNIV